MSNTPDKLLILSAAFCQLHVNLWSSLLPQAMHTCSPCIGGICHLQWIWHGLRRAHAGCRCMHPSTSWSSPTWAARSVLQVSGCASCIVRTHVVW